MLRHDEQFGRSGYECPCPPNYLKYCLAGYTMRSRLSILLPTLALLAGCSNMTPALVPLAQPEADAAYVAGLFSRNKGMNFALILRSADGSREYRMPMGEDSRLPTAIAGNSIAIKVLPGTYTITKWMTYSTMTKELFSSFPAQEDMAKSFTVAPGTVVHLGSFELESEVFHKGIGWNYTSGYKMCVRPLHASERDVRAAFARAYPLLSTLPITCIACDGKLAVK